MGNGRMTLDTHRNPVEISSGSFPIPDARSVRVSLMFVFGT